MAMFETGQIVSRVVPSPDGKSFSITLQVNGEEIGRLDGNPKTMKHAIAWSYAFMKGAAFLALHVNKMAVAPKVARSQYAFTVDSCPSKHWNDGTDICADCGADLNGGEGEEI